MGLALIAKTLNAEGSVTTAAAYQTHAGVVPFLDSGDPAERVISRREGLETERSRRRNPETGRK